jgi:predicted site-specific integrase-resolvase
MVGAPRAFYPQKETMAILGMSRSTLHRLVQEGRLEVKHVGDRKVVYTHRSIMKLVFGDEYKEDKDSVQLCQLVSALVEQNERLDGRLRQLASVQEGYLKVLRKAGVDVDLE